ncbi:MAG: hypothetical protein AB1422_16630, partial [bacterium]
MQLFLNLKESERPFLVLWRFIRTQMFLRTSFWWKLQWFKRYFLSFYLGCIYTWRYEEFLKSVNKERIKISKKFRSWKFKGRFIIIACRGYFISRYDNSIFEFYFHLMRAEIFAYWYISISVFDTALDEYGFDKVKGVDLTTRCLLAIWTGKEKITISDLSSIILSKFEKGFKEPLKIPKESIFYPP